MQGTPTVRARKLPPVRRVATTDVFEITFTGAHMAMLSADLRRAAPTSREVARTPATMTATFPLLCLRPSYLLELLATMPFEMAVLPPMAPWQDDYESPLLGLDSTTLGWGIVLKGQGHDRWIASRRWLEYGPYRVIYGPYDTTLVQFHDGTGRLDQVREAHEWIASGLLRPRHLYEHAVKGDYSEYDGLLRVHVKGREVTDRELLDATAARRDRQSDATRPLRNIAYVFDDASQARAHLDALWLRELECHAIVDGKLRRLDDTYFRRVSQPDWVQTLALAH